MDGFFNTLEKIAAGSVPSGVIIAATVLFVGVIIAGAVLRFIAPIGAGAGKAIGDAGTAVAAIGEGVGAIGEGIGRTVGGPGALMEGWAAAAEQRAKNDEENFVLKLEDGMGRTVFVQAHGPQTAPKMPDVMGGVPMLPAPSPEVVGLLAAPKKGGKGKK